MDIGFWEGLFMVIFGALLWLFVVCVFVVVLSIFIPRLRCLYGWHKWSLSESFCLRCFKDKEKY